MRASSESRRSQIESYGWQIFDSFFMKFEFRIGGGITFWDPVEDSNTGGPTTVTVRMEYLLFNSDIVNFVWKTDEGEAQSIILLIFGLW